LNIGPKARREYFLRPLSLGCAGVCLCLFSGAALARTMTRAID
jgi:hypothetical protein